MTHTQKPSHIVQKYWNRAVITWASWWIGRECSVQLAQQWYNIIAVARDHTKLSQLQHELQSAYHITCKIISADLSTTIWIDSVITCCDTHDVGIAMMNAGFGTSGAFDQSQISKEVNMLQLNCISTLQLTHYFVQKFVPQHRWVIILLSSVLAFQWTAYSANYAATKAYIQTLWEWLAQELQWSWVDILTVAPWPVDTWFSDTAQMTFGTSADVSDIVRDILWSLGQTTFVYPWLLSKLIWYSLALLPRRAKSKVMKMVMKSMIQH